MSKLELPNSPSIIGIKIIPENYTQEDIDEIMYQYLQSKIKCRMKLSLVFSSITLLLIVWSIITTYYNPIRTSIPLFGILLNTQIASFTITPLVLTVYTYQETIFEKRKNNFDLINTLLGLICLISNIIIFYLYVDQSIITFLTQNQGNNGIIITSFIISILVITISVIGLLYIIYKYISVCCKSCML
jgi:hypothetical protein